MPGKKSSRTKPSAKKPTPAASTRTAKPKSKAAKSPARKSPAKAPSKAAPARPAARPATRPASAAAARIAALERELKNQSLHAALFEEIRSLTEGDFELRGFLNRLVDRVTRATDAGAATLFLLDEPTKTLEFAVVRGPGAARLTGRRIPADEGIAGRVISTGRAYNSSDASTDPIWSGRIDGETGLATRNILAVPLLMGGKPRGVIELLNKKDGLPFSTEDLALLKTLADESTIGIENARLLMDARGQADRFMALSRISGLLNSTLSPKLVRKAAMQAAVELLECETGSLYLIDEAKGELYFEVALGESGEAIKEIRLKIGEGVAGWVAQEGKSDLVPDTSLDPRWAKKVDEKSKFKTRNMVTVPVRAHGKIIGVLQALNKLRDRKFDTLDLNLLENLADQVGIALENARLYEAQKEMFVETAQALATAIEKRDPYTGGHTRRVRDFSVATAKYLKLSPHDLEWLTLAAILHDIGKIGVPDGVLNKPARLDDGEFMKMKSHPAYGFEILQHVKPLAPAIPGMKHHHERFDGRGYPDGLKGEDIPLIARIIAVADTWDAMTSDRPYRKGLPDEVAAAELRKFSGAQFDPVAVEAFLKAWENKEIHSQHEGDPPCDPIDIAACMKPKGAIDDGEK